MLMSKTSLLMDKQPAHVGCVPLARALALMYFLRWSVLTCRLRLRMLRLMDLRVSVECGLRMVIYVTLFFTNRSLFMWPLEDES